MKYYRGINIIKRSKKVLIGIIILISICAQTKGIYAAENNVVKVGYPSVSGFTDIKDGIYTGYFYEYLTEITKYTGWEYEFIEMSLNDLMYKLRDGEIDLAAGMLKNEQTQELYSFPEENAGYTYTTLSVLKDNKSISGNQYETLNGIKVGYYETFKVRLNHFINFCEKYGIEDVKLIAYPYDNANRLLDALKNKEVDAIISGDLLMQDEERVIAKFGQIPYYFATTKGNKEILIGLNNALSKIKENDPSFDQRLYNKYFQNHNDNKVYLTQEEKDYIEHMTPLKVAYVDNFAPMQDYNPKTMKGEGFCIDIMDIIGERSGLKYEWVKASNYEEAYEMIKNKEIDLLVSAPDSYLQATQYGYSLTQSYYEVNMVKIFNIEQQNKKGKQIIALPKGYISTQFKDKYEIHYYETVEECLKAVETGKADLSYGNSYNISNHLISGHYSNLTTFFEEIPIKGTIGISKPTNLTLMNIINKSVSSLSESEIQNIIYQNTLNRKDVVTLKQFFYDNLSFCISVIILFGVLIYIIVRTRYKRLVQDKLLLQEKLQIDVLTQLYNRATGVDLVTKYLETKESYLSGVLMIIDIDYFKQVNDHLGHQRGDKLLIEFSQTLKQVFSSEDIIFRLGGDEFVVFMTNIELTNLPMVEGKLKELCQHMNKEVHFDGHSQNISLSIGAIVTNHIYNFNTLYHEADQILYEVKRNGRNGFKIKALD